MEYSQVKTAINFEKFGIYIAALGFRSIVWTSEMSTKHAIFIGTHSKTGRQELIAIFNYENSTNLDEKQAQVPFHKLV